MAILHGSWLLQPQDYLTHLPPAASADVSQAGLPGGLFVWGETWRSLEPIVGSANQPHPFAMTAAELIDFLRSLCQSHQLQWAVEEVPLGQRTATRSRKGDRKLDQADQAAGPEDEPPARWQTTTCTLPTYRYGQPGGSEMEPDLAYMVQHSAAVRTAPLVRLEPDGAEAGDNAGELMLHPWQLGGFWLTPQEAVQLLNSLPLGAVQAEDSWLGADLRFWAHVARWRLDLLARSKFLPGLRTNLEQPTQAYWQALLDSAVDQERLETFARHMPGACRTYQRAIAPQAQASQANYPAPHDLLLQFLNRTIEAEVRLAVADQPLPPTQLPKDIPLREWLQALGAEPGQYDVQPPGPIVADPSRVERLQAILSTWTSPLQRHLDQRLASFRICFRLQPPAPGDRASGTDQSWTLEYYLQAAHDPDVVISAKTIWDNPVEQLAYQGHTIDQPQETLLAGLGLASRLYPVIEPSLQTQHPQACQLSPAQVYEFIKSMAWRLQDSGFGVILPPGLTSAQGWASRLGLEIRAETPRAGKKQRLGLQSLLNFKWELSIGGQRISKEEFDRLVALNTPLVEINGEWVELRSQDVRAAQAFFANRKDQLSLSLEDALRMSSGDTQMIEKLPVVSFEASGPLEELIQTLTTGNQQVELISTPETFQGELRPYQQRGVAWLAFLQRWGLGACLADDMGLGKTIQLIALLLHLQQQDTLDQPTLLVCPTSLLGNWEREVRRFGPSLNVMVHHGDKRHQDKAFAKAVRNQHLVITSYALIYRDVKTLQQVSWQGVVLDEAQNIKNPEAKQSQAVRQLDTQFRIALTGTPVENRLSELWSILDFLNPGYLGPRNFFQRRFAMPIERYGDTASLTTLRSLVQPFILRRLKTDRDIIQDLPDKQEMTVFCSLAAEQAALYQTLVDRSLVEIESAEDIQRRGMILALLTKLKQVCNHPTLLKTDEGKRSDPPPEAALPADSGKLQRLEEMLDELLAEGDRALIFTQFAEWGKLLSHYLAQRFGREILYLYGSTSKKQREEMVDRFQNDPQGPRLFVLSLKAGGVGLNLTRANHVFHFDRWWNPAVENQATDRVFRIGQTRNVQVHKFVCTGTLEERIHELIESKKALSEQVVGGGENWLTDFDTDQLRNLLLLDRSAVIDD